MGYRKEIKALRKRLALFVAELREAEREENWGRVSYLASEISAMGYDIHGKAESKALRG